MLKSLCRPLLIEKIRHEIECGGNAWWVDEFLGDHSGLVLAEIELNDPGQSLALPSWAGEEVTENPAYRNANLASGAASWRR